MFKPSQKSANMSHLQTRAGTFTANEVIGAIGQPHHQWGDKTTMEWIMEDENGNIVTLYDYKQDAWGFPTSQIMWSVGGFDKDTAIRFHAWLRERIKNSLTYNPFDSSWDKIPGGC